MTTLTLTADQLRLIAQLCDADMTRIAEHAGRCLADRIKADREARSPAAPSIQIFEEDDHLDYIEELFVAYLAAAHVLDLAKTAAGLSSATDTEHRQMFNATAEAEAGLRTKTIDN